MPWLRRVVQALQAVSSDGSLAKPQAESRVLGLGFLCWALTNLVPLLHRLGQLPRWALLLAALPPCALVSGVWLSETRQKLATYVLLAGFPVAIALGMSSFDHELALSTFSPASLLFGALSLLAYAAAACQLSAAHEPERKVDHKPLGEVAPVDAEARKQRVGGLVLSCITVGSAVAVCFASWQSPLDYREHWGRAAAHGAVLSALLAGLIGCVALSMVAPGLRAERKRKKARETRMKGVLRLLLTSFSFALLYLLSRR